MVLLGEGVSELERSILAGTEVKADTKVILHGHKIWAWTAWSLLAGAKVREAHEEPEKSEAPDESTDDE